MVQDPGIDFTLRGNDEIIINSFDSKKKISETEILEFIDSLNDISGEVCSITTPLVSELSIR